MRARCRLAVLCLSLVAVAAGNADAATVSTIEEYCFRGSCSQQGTVTFKAASGERNVVTITREGEHDLLLHDDAAPLTVRGRCTAVDEHTARCERPGYSTDVELADGDDELQAYVAVRAEGGAGDDVLRAFAGDVYGGGVLLGGPGDDLLDASQAGDRGFSLVGGRGDDRLIGGPAGYEVLEPGPGADRVDGGDGEGDRFSHGDRAAPLTLSLAQRRGTEDPLVTGIEIVTGGRGDDRIAGGDRSDTLEGRGGDDRLDGAGGDDRIAGGLGADRLSGGSGDDRLHGWIAPPDNVPSDRADGGDQLAGGEGDDMLDGGPAPDRVRCGNGRDTVAAADGDALPAAVAARATDCERLNFRATHPGSFCMALDDVVRIGSRLRIGDACPHQPRLQLARQVVLRGAGGRRLGSGTARPIRRSPLTLALSAAARPLLRPGAARELRVGVQRIGPRGRTLATTTVRVALHVRASKLQP